MNARSPLAVAPAKTKKLKVVPNEATTQTSHHVDEIEDSNPDFVTAIGRGFAILRCFKRNAKVLGNKELAEMTGLPKSTVARLTFTLTKLGYLNFLPAIEKYGFCFSLGEWNNDVFAVGVPMVSNDGSKVLAFSCSGPVHEMTRKRIISDIGPRLVQLRDRVQTMLGGVF